MNELDIPVLRPPTRLSARSAPLFEAVTKGYYSGEAGGVILDLKDVESITSVGLSQLVLFGRRLSENDAVLALMGGGRAVTRLLRIVGLERVIPHFKTLDEATRWVREQRDQASGSE